jgi:hypothetical protein
MTCKEAKSLISPYLDGVVTGQQMRALSDHMGDCSACGREYVLLKHTQDMVASLGRRQPPAELTLKLRVMVSQQAAIQRRPWLDSLQVRLSHAVRAFMVPATAGALTAIVIFGLLIGFFALPAPLSASSDDVPTMLYTPPQLVMSPFAGGVNAVNGDSLIVEALVDASGRVQDYRILSAPENYREIMPQVQNVLIFTVFQPARSFGRPTAGKTVLSFSKINVQG